MLFNDSERREASDKLLELQIRWEMQAVKSPIDFMKYVYGYESNIKNWVLVDYILKPMTLMDMMVQGLIDADMLHEAFGSQMGKSTAVIVYIAYCALKYRKNIVFVTYSKTLAERTGERVRYFISEYGYLFGVRLSNSIATKTNMVVEDSKSGKRVCELNFSTKEGQLSGLPADVIFIDDFLKGIQDVWSSDKRDKDEELLESNVMSRVSSDCKIISVGTFYHDDDVYNRCKKKLGDRFIEVKIPVMCTNEETDFLGRKYGEYIGHEIGKDEAFWKKFQSRISSKLFKIMFLCDTSNYIEEGLKREMFKKYNRNDRLKEFISKGKFYLSVDSAQKEGSGDYSVVQIWCELEDNYYLLDCERGQWGLTQFVNRTYNMINKYETLIGRGLDGKFIELQGGGFGLVDILRNNHGVEGISGISQSKSKSLRLELTKGLIENGFVHLPVGLSIEGASDMSEELINEVVEFNNNYKHDDMMDTMTTFLMRMLRTEVGIIMNEEIEVDVSKEADYDKELLKVSEKELRNDLNNYFGDNGLVF